MHAFPITGDQLARLEQLARAATPGPWRAPRGACEVSVAASGHLVAVTHTQFPDRPRAHHEEDAQYLAALSPEVVLALLDELRELRAMVDAPDQPTHPTMD